MKTTRIFLILLIYHTFNINVNAQELLKPDNEKTYVDYVSKVLSPINKSDGRLFRNSILYDRVYPVAGLTQFNNSDSTNTSNYNHFIQSWNELYSSSTNKKNNDNP